MVRQQIIGRECDKIVAQGMDLACNQTISFINTMTCSSLKGKKRKKARIPSWRFKTEFLFRSYDSI